MNNYILSSLCTTMCQFLHSSERVLKYKDNLEEFRLSVKSIQAAAADADEKSQYISTVSYKENISSLFLSAFIYKKIPFIALYDIAKDSITFYDRLGGMESTKPSQFGFWERGIRRVIKNGAVTDYMKKQPVYKAWVRIIPLLDAVIARTERFNSMYRDENGNIKNVAHGPGAWLDYQNDIRHMVAEYEGVQAIRQYYKENGVNVEVTWDNEKRKILADGHGLVQLTKEHTWQYSPDVHVPDGLKENLKSLQPVPAEEDEMLEQEWKMEVEKAMAEKEGQENTDAADTEGVPWQEDTEEKDTGDCEERE